MPDIPIDLSEGIPSVRLKVPTGVVPIPPAGFGQLHTPAPGELALRLPDGSVVPVGGGGGGGGDTITGDGGSVSTDATPGHDPGVVVSPVLGKTIWLNGPVVGPGESDPQAPDGVTLAVRASAPALPLTGLVVLWLDDDYRLRGRNEFDEDKVTLGAPNGARLDVQDGNVALSGGGDAGAVVDAVSFTAHSLGHVLSLTDLYLHFYTNGNPLVLHDLPTADPHVDGQLWIAPITRQLMVSAG